jgi:hypothetical protein
VALGPGFNHVHDLWQLSDGEEPLMKTADTPTYLYMLECVFGSAALEADWNQWYDQVHIPLMLSVPGVMGCVRYARLDTPGSYLAVYELSSPEVLEHPRYLEVRGWGRWEPNMRSWSRTMARRQGERVTFFAPGIDA